MRRRNGGTPWRVRPTRPRAATPGSGCRSWVPADRRRAITADGIVARRAHAVVEPQHDFEIGVEVLVRAPYSEPCPVGLLTQTAAQERDEPLALRERPPLVVSVAGSRRTLLDRNGAECEEVALHVTTIS